MSYFINIKNKTFGRLTVLKRVRNHIRHNGYTTVRWLCQCKCRNKIITSGIALRSNHTKSCGCLHKESIKIIGENQKTHGDTLNRTITTEYRAWQALKTRCYWRPGKDYRNYGGRGISVCKKWLDSYRSFLKDMGRKPTYKHSLDRINVNGNYTPFNCRWATAKEQVNNRRTKC